MKKRYLLYCVIAVLLILVSCGKEPDLVLAADGRPNIVVVRPSDGEQTETDAAIDLMLFLKEYYSTEEITLATDRKAPDASRVEILVGATSRMASSSVRKTLKKDEYAVTISEGKLVIAGGSAEATAAAVEYFIENCTGALDAGLFTAEDAYIYRVEGGVGSAYIGGVELSDYVIVYPADADKYGKSLIKQGAEELRDGIADLTGCYLRLCSDEGGGKHEILYGETSRAASAEAYGKRPDYYETAIVCGEGTLAVAPGGTWAASDLRGLLSRFVDGDSFDIPVGTDGLFGEAPTPGGKAFVYYSKDAAPDTPPVKELTVCGTDISKFTVVCHDYGEEPGHESELYAAKELVKYIKFACGVELEIAYDTATCDREILIGAVDRDLPFRLDELTSDGLCIYTDSDRLYIAGEGRRGTLYGVYEFLEKYVGYRFFASDCEVVYKAESIDVPAGINDKQESDIFYRDVYAYDILFGSFAAKRKVNGYYMRSFSREEGGGEVFAGGNGGFVHTITRVFCIGDLDRQPCLTDKENYEKAKLILLGILENNPDSRIVSISQNDNYNCCRCKDCSAVNREEGSEAGTLIRFINALADDIKDAYPDVKILTLAYMYSADPPVTRPRDNVIIELCAYDYCTGHAYGECSGNDEFLEQLAGWHEMTDDLFIWDYIADFNKSYTHVPFMNFDQIYDNFRIFRQYGVTGYFGEGNSGKPGTEFGELRSYLISRLMWDPDVTREEYDTMIREFIDAYYGSGSAAIERYFDFIRRTSAGRHFDLYSSTGELLSGALFNEARTEMARWFNTATALAENDPEAEQLHVRRLRESFETLYKYYKDR